MEGHGLDLLTQEERHLVLRQDFATFIAATFCHLNPTTPFAANWHIDLIASKLEACRTGKIKRLIINIPPRNLKSICASIALPAFWLGHDPSAQIICVSYAQDLSNKLSMDCRDVMASSWYQELFPTRLSRARMAVEEFTTTRQGFRKATSVGGVITGRGADVLILDDPMKPDEAMSDVERKRVNDWYDQTLYSRLNHKEKGCIIVIMQRLHVDDLVGHVLDRDDWDVLSLPAIASEDEQHIYENLGGTFLHKRRAGELLHPERESLSTLAQLKRNLGEYAFAGQYQQSPVPLEGGLVKNAWWGVYEGDPGPFERVIQSWDTANKDTELSDYSVCTTWGIKDRKVYLLDVHRKRMNFPDLKRTVGILADRWSPQIILIEDKASGTPLIQELRQAGAWHVRGCKPDRDKVMRMNTQTAFIETGDVLLPKSAPWLMDYLAELGTFPKGRHDDQVDSTSQALAWIQENQGPAPEMLFLEEETRWVDELDSYLGDFGASRSFTYL